MTPNPFLLAADNSPELLPLLRKNPSLAPSQDEHGYSLVHAAASYNHFDLLRALIAEFKVDVDLKDEDNETALFVVETPEMAKVLVEEFGADPLHRGTDGFTAKEKIEEEGDFPAVVAYLSTFESGRKFERTTADATSESIPPPPEGLQIRIDVMDQGENVPTDVDQEFRRRIDELAQRDDIDTPEGQAELRKVVEDALAGQGLGGERSVRNKTD
ncbi:uncharacterized protein GMORB2_7367 [Geosmithia morbida]|uniref:Ankyrin repeat protein n=1 Tax=Geosmithia morbida TaxID=1094350 RepID=A0A9P5D421_9HYPO|nr:uncharacterized protein GMORB2_7367 [Geosmithia morbida]KAF4122375.1 uncharacterized protein GMORB2_7367 [Geosmithia morbida]